MDDRPQMSRVASLIRILIGALFLELGADKFWRYAHPGAWWRAILGGLLAVIGVWIAVTAITGAWRHRHPREAQSKVSLSNDRWS
jgi:hypothetical protein